MGERGTESMGARPEPLRTGSAPGPQSRPAPGWSLSRTIRAWPGLARILYGGPRPVLGPFAHWGPIRF